MGIFKSIKHGCVFNFDFFKIKRKRNRPTTEVFEAKKRQPNKH